jgi:hypothetical protein
LKSSAGYFKRNNLVKEIELGDTRDDNKSVDQHLPFSPISCVSLAVAAQQVLSIDSAT